MKHKSLNDRGLIFLKKDQYIKAINHFERAVDLKPEYIDALYNLGLAYHKNGNLDKAIRIYKKIVYVDSTYALSSENRILSVIYFFSQGKIYEALDILNKLIELNPRDALIYNMLGGCYASNGQIDLAIENYQKALEYQPEYAIPQHMINSLTGFTSKEPPKEYVKNLFDDYAERFNDSLVVNLQYNLPFIIKDLIFSFSNKIKYGKVIDLGCGTGLSAEGLRSISRNLTGVDLSENMILEANKLNLYDELIVGDIVDVLNSTQFKYELFVALDVLIYVGDADLFFKTIRKYCYQNALLIFSIELQQEKGFSLLKSSRYSHSEDYIMNLLSSGFDFVKSKDVKLRKEGGNWIEGKIYAFKAN
jgi:predicted TPR repeat methyltransferase